MARSITNPSGQLVCFKIRPYRSRLYYTVRVFKGVRPMRHYARDLRRRRGWSVLGLGRFEGLATGWTIQRRVYKHWVTCAHAGEILLWKGRLGSLVVAHECLHIALGWARRVGVNVASQRSKHQMVSAEEERVCHVLGELVRGVYAGLYRHKILS